MNTISQFLSTNNFQPVSIATDGGTEAYGNPETLQMVFLTVNNKLYTLPPSVEGAKEIDIDIDFLPLQPTSMKPVRDLKWEEFERWMLD